MDEESQTARIFLSGQYAFDDENLIAAWRDQHPVAFERSTET